MDASLAFDSVRNTFVLFGGSNGSYLGGTWLWNGSQWTQRTVPEPSGRWSPASAFDSNRQRVVLFGGFAGVRLNDTWEWNGTSWTQMAVQGPPARTMHCIAFDSRRNVIVMFGGEGGAGLLSDTWEYGPPCTAPSVTTQPASQTACITSSVTFTTTIAGTTPSLQWRKNGTNIQGATSATYTIASVSAADAGAYDCVATNSCGNVTTSQAVLTVNAQTSITAQPQAQALVPGATATFQVTATGAGLAYQWRRDGSALTGSARIGGVNSNTLTIATVAAGDQGLYDCVITGTCGNATSSAASLGCGPVFTQQPQGGSVVGGSSITLSTNVLTAGATTYRWRKNGVNIFNSQTYSGALASTLVINVNDPNDTGTYTLAVSNSCGSEVSAAATVTVSCLADFTRDGGVDGDDVIQFFGLWDANASTADVNLDGGIDGDDVITFFDRWDRGC
jgi:hypothetical protein